MLRLALLFILSLIGLQGLCAQGKFNQNWYFGYGAAMDFSTSPPTIKSDNNMNAYEGSNCISDSATGKLLLYTNGKVVYNAQHDTIGKISIPTGEMVILPVKTKPGVYALIGVSIYHWVDVNANGGTGAIVATGVTPFASPINRITAVKHCFNQDYWIISAENNGAGGTSFCAFRMRPDGSFSTKTCTPFSGISLSTYCGDLVSSFDGTRLALSNYGPDGTFIVADFDKKCGIFSNIKEIKSPKTNYDYPFGLSFSPNGKWLYVSYSVSESQLVQYDVGNFANYTEVATSTENFNQMMCGPDGKLYITTHISGIPSPKMDVIHSPNLAGTACNYQENYLYLKGPTEFHVPNFVVNHTGGGCVPGKPIINIKVPDVLCVKNPGTFQANFTPGTYQSVLWDFGDLNYSTQQQTTHAYQFPGVYRGMVVLQYCSNFDTIKFTVLVNSGIWFNLPNDTTICANDTLLIKANVPAGSKKWNTGDTADHIWASKAGAYVLTVTQGVCVNSDTMVLKKYPDLWTTLGKEYYICEKDKDLVLLDAGTGFKEYLWKPTGDTTQWIIVSKQGNYYVVVKDFRGCNHQDGTVVQIRCDMDAFVPTSFTPNGDGLNDVFLPVGHDIVSMNMAIYDRWGQKIFATDKPGEGWNGTFAGRPCPPGTYVFVVMLQGSLHKNLIKRQLNGTVELLR